MRTQCGTNYNCGWNRCSARKPTIPSIVRIVGKTSPKRKRILESSVPSPAEHGVFHRSFHADGQRTAAPFLRWHRHKKLHCGTDVRSCIGRTIRVGTNVMTELLLPALPIADPRALLGPGPPSSPPSARVRVFDLSRGESVDRARSASSTPVLAKHITEWDTQCAINPFAAGSGTQNFPVRSDVVQAVDDRVSRLMQMHTMMTSRSPKLTSLGLSRASPARETESAHGHEKPTAPNPMPTRDADTAERKTVPDFLHHAGAKKLSDLLSGAARQWRLMRAWKAWRQVRRRDQGRAARSAHSSHFEALGGSLADQQLAYAEKLVEFEDTKEQLENAEQEIVCLEADLHCSQTELKDCEQKLTALASDNASLSSSLAETKSALENALQQLGQQRSADQRAAQTHSEDASLLALRAELAQSQAKLSACEAEVRRIKNTKLQKKSFFSCLSAGIDDT